MWWRNPAIGFNLCKRTRSTKVEAVINLHLDIQSTTAERNCSTLMTKKTASMVVVSSTPPKTAVMHPSSKPESVLIAEALFAAGQLNSYTCA